MVWAEKVCDIVLSLLVINLPWIVFLVDHTVVTLIWLFHEVAPNKTLTRTHPISRCWKMISSMCTKRRNWYSWEIIFLSAARISRRRDCTRHEHWGHDDERSRSIHTVHCGTDQCVHYHKALTVIVSPVPHITYDTHDTTYTCTFESSFNRWISGDILTPVPLFQVLTGESQLIYLHLGSLHLYTWLSYRFNNRFNIIYGKTPF
jgi:hypothetical protein